MPNSLARCVLSAALLVQIGVLNAEPITIFSASQFRDIRSENSVNFVVGDRHVFSVFVEPFDGTTLEVVNGSSSLQLPSTPDRPTEFARSFGFGSLPLTPWTATAQNGSDTSVAVTNSLVGVDELEFVRNARIAPNDLTPTLLWDLPQGFGGPTDFMRVGYFDDETNFRLPFDSGSIFENLPATTTSYTFADGTLEYGEAYVFRVVTARNEPGVGQTRATTFLNFTPIPGSGGPEVFIPTVDSTGVFNFDIDVSAGESVILDPFVATGYAYEIGDGNPNFASVILPSLGDDEFTLTYVDPNTGLDIVETLLANELLIFPSGGVGSFVVNGIEAELGLDPSDVTAFMTEVTFVADGAFTGNMMPITQFVPDPSVPAPAPFALLAGALVPLIFTKRRQRAKTTA